MWRQTLQNLKKSVQTGAEESLSKVSPIIGLNLQSNFQWSLFIDPYFVIREHDCKFSYFLFDNRSHYFICLGNFKLPTDAGIIFPLYSKSLQPKRFLLLQKRFSEIPEGCWIIDNVFHPDQKVRTIDKFNQNLCQLYDVLKDNYSDNWTHLRTFIIVPLRITALHILCY